MPLAVLSKLVGLQVPEHLIVNEHGGLDKFKYTVIEAILETTVGEVSTLCFVLNLPVSSAV